MPRLDQLWNPRNRGLVLTVSGLIVLGIALADWWTKPYVSLGFFYLFPIMLAAGFLRRSAIVVLGVGGAALSQMFSSLERSYLRVGFEALALTGCGLFVAELVRNRRIGVAVQARLQGLVETSPAAIVTVDERGLVDLANQAAVELMNPRGGDLKGSPIAAYLPDLHHALRLEDAPQFRSSMQCRGHRSNGETFICEVWFSTFKEAKKPKLAAIITLIDDPASDRNSVPAMSDESRAGLSSRETVVLQLLVQGLANKEIASQLEVSESVVKNTFQQLFSKTGVRTRSQLVRVAVEQYRDLL
jgi:two-component system sensor kinase FixL